MYFLAFNLLPSFTFNCVFLILACACRLCARLCAGVVHALCAVRGPSLVRFERHKAFALFRIALLALHKAFDPCAKFVSLIFSVKHSIII